ncbi:hypothetical protein [uncultured Chitinophaga sp.]|jgi:Predicted membrane protein|uniref:DoxX family protein n=1 Tax=uncultured Chitinophaga sp. TaxID=339340 RepID=UPI00262AAC0E|nr:hypothetical protein [uncultured Chitinophaga sp.]
METLAVLIPGFVISALICRWTTGEWRLTFSANLAMCLMLFLTATGHVLFTKGMAMMVPPFIPFKTAIVYITGVMEVLMGLALLVPALRRHTGYAVIVFFILLLPANIYGAVVQLNMQQGSYDGPGPEYLWFRVPLQVLFIGWVWYWSVRKISAPAPLHTPDMPLA